MSPTTTSLFASAGSVTPNGISSDGATPGSPDPESQWRQWHREREAALAQPHGWLSVVGLEWLASTPTVVAGFPGLFWIDDGGQAQFDPGTFDLIDLRIGSTLASTTSADVAEAQSLSWLQQDEVLAELVRRTGRLGVRLRDAQAPARLGFTGVPTFEYDQKWLTEGTFAQFAEPLTLVVGAAHPGLEHHQLAVGSVSFSLDGQPQRLLAFGSPESGLQLPFHDPTNDLQSAPWRTLAVSPPDQDGNVIVDFNRAINLPFAFSDFGTCPRPPVENLISVAVTAGEKRPQRL